MVRVKICGVTRVEDALAAVGAGAWAIGLNFYARSSRCVTVDAAAGIVAALPRTTLTVGVFVNESRARISEITHAVGLRAIQLHGDESPADCANWPLPVIKAVRMRDRETVAIAARYPVDFILLDAYVEGHAGGTGCRFAWEWAAACDRSRLILAGGLTPDNVADAVRAVRPLAVDVASGIERVPGVKDVQLMTRFIANAQTA
ncbi:MAG TPA: phosphoribosylanthranilate isomerase [Candidatus Kryptonia bacterium]|nr:phosphoribosylanthranilate isomerase [Candidatus Kryptonia bacterium]